MHGDCTSHAAGEMFLCVSRSTSHARGAAAKLAVGRSLPATAAAAAKGWAV